MEIGQLYPAVPETARDVRGLSGQDQFLALLMQQLRAQDPLEPVDNADFMTQVSQYSQMEQFQALNDNLLGMLALQSQLTGLEQLSEATGLIGQRVTFLADGGTEVEGIVERVLVEEGRIVLETDDGTQFGLHQLRAVSGANQEPSDNGGGDEDTKDDGEQNT